ACHVTQELVWLCMLLLAVKFPQTMPTPLLCDNQRSIVLSNNPSFHTHIRHINIKYITSTNMSMPTNWCYNGSLVP
ncbi:hypothetical protein BS17DRAFT_689068, partial [Gyrodon lividus]